MRLPAGGAIAREWSVLHRARNDLSLPTDDSCPHEEGHVRMFYKSVCEFSANNRDTGDPFAFG